MSAIGCGLMLLAAGPRAQIVFEDVTAAVGIDYVHHFQAADTATRYGAGAAVSDYDHDGDLDVFICDGPNFPNQLWRNDGGSFTEVGAAAGVAGLRSSQVALFVDLDGDAWDDLLVVNNGFPARSNVYQNNRDGTFTVRGAGISATETVFGGATAADYDKDGDLDLYVTGWGQGNVWLFRNEGNFAFTDVTAAAGARPLRGTAPIPGWTPIMVDLDDDGWADIFSAVDFAPNFVLHNNGDGTFSDVTNGSGCAHTGNDMGVAVADYDNDLDLDFYITNITGSGSSNCPVGSGDACNSLNDNLGGLLFADVADTMGVADTDWGWGTAFVDVDLDGDRDLYAVNGFYPYLGVDQTAYFFRNDAGTFVEAGAAAGLAHDGDSRSLVPFDYDNDGDIDFLVLDVNGAAHLFENKTPHGDNHWLIVDARGLADNSAGVGARVYVTAGGLTQMAEIMVGGSFYAGPPIEAHFGLGTAAVVDEIRVVFPRGAEIAVQQVPADRRIVLGPLDEARHVRLDRPAGATGRLSWDPVERADGYSLTRGDLGSLRRGGGYGACLRPAEPATSFDDADVPLPGKAFVYLVRAESSLGIAGSVGTDPSGAERVTDACP